MRLSRITDLLRFRRRRSCIPARRSGLPVSEEAGALERLASNAIVGPDENPDQPDHDHTLNDLEYAEDLLAGCRFDEARRILEYAHTDDGDRHRLLLNVCKCVTGEKAAAKLELFSWLNEGAIPDEARALLALLLYEDDDESGALAVIQTRTRANCSASQPVCDFLHALMQQERGRVPEAQELAARLIDAGAKNKARMSVLDGRLIRLGLRGAVEASPGSTWTEAISENDVLEFESSLPAIVEGVHLSGEAIWATKLAHAIAQALPRMQDRRTAFELMVQLALTARLPGQARSWARAGLREFPRSAPLLLAVLGRQPSIDEPVEPPEVETVVSQAAARDDQPSARRTAPTFPATDATVTTAINRERTTTITNAGDRPA